MQANPVLESLEPDVEALLVNRVGHAREASAAEYYIAPIDACYQLVGLIRVHWRGLSGGDGSLARDWQLLHGSAKEIRVVTEASYA